MYFIWGGGVSQYFFWLFDIEERAYEEAEYLAYVREQEKKKEFQKRYEAEQRQNSYSRSTSSTSTNSTAYISSTSSKKKESSPNIGFIGWLLFIAIIVLFVDAIVEMLTTGFGKGIFILAKLSLTNTLKMKTYECSIYGMCFGKDLFHKT